MAKNGVYLDGVGLAHLERDLFGAAAALVGTTEHALQAAGERVRDKAKSNASQAGSTSIPETIVGAMDGPNTYRVQAGNANTPIAGLWELGNKGRGESAPGTFRHPVYGTDTWVEQPRFPFLRPALESESADLYLKAELAYDEALTPFNLRPEPISGFGAEQISRSAGILPGNIAYGKVGRGAGGRFTAIGNL